RSAWRGRAHGARACDGPAPPPRAHRGHGRATADLGKPDQPQDARRRRGRGATRAARAGPDPGGTGGLGSAGAVRGADPHQALPSGSAPRPWVAAPEPVPAGLTVLRRVDRYLVREFLPPFLLGLFVLTFTLLTNLIVKLTEWFINKGVSFQDILRI